MFAALTVTALIILGLIAVRSRHHKRYPSPKQLLNSQGIVAKSLAPDGAVLVHGELWLARSLDGTHIPANSTVIVVGTDSHVILVA
jgi:membrane-bound serine protease (ClpP class)